MNKITPLLFLPLATRRRRREIQRWGLQYRLYLRLPSIPLDRSHDNRLCSAIRARSRAEGSIPRRRSAASRPLRASPAERFRSGGGGRNSAQVPFWMQLSIPATTTTAGSGKVQTFDFSLSQSTSFNQLLDLEHRRKYSLSNFFSCFRKFGQGCLCFHCLQIQILGVFVFFQFPIFFDVKTLYCPPAWGHSGSCSSCLRTTAANN